MSEFKEYMWCSHDGIIRPAKFRETKVYFFAENGDRYKKGEYPNGALAFRVSGSGWGRSQYYIHALDCPTVAKYAERDRRKMAVYKLKRELEALFRSDLSYDKAVELAQKLDLKID